MQAIKPLLVLGFLVTFVAFLGCSEDSNVNELTYVLGGDEGDLPATTTIESITDGFAGDEVTITGTGFSSALPYNVMVFAPAESVTPSSATTTELTVILPEEGHIGTMTLTVGLQSTSFFYQGFKPRLSGAAPSSGTTGDSIILTGTGFDCATLSNNTVSFGADAGTAVAATVTAANAITGADNTMQVTVPANLPDETMSIFLTVESEDQSSATTSIEFTKI